MARGQSVRPLAMIIIILLGSSSCVQITNATTIDLAVLYSWENVNRDGLTAEAQTAGIETLADYLSEQLTTSVEIYDVKHSLGKTPQGHLSTVASLLISKTVGDPALAGQQARSLLGIDQFDASSNVGPILRTLTADIPIRILRNESNESILKQRVMNKVAGYGKRGGATGRTLSAYEGLDAAPRLAFILVMEDSKVEYSERRRVEPAQLSVGRKQDGFTRRSTTAGATTTATRNTKPTDDSTTTTTTPTKGKIDPLTTNQQVVQGEPEKGIDRSLSVTQAVVVVQSESKSTTTTTTTQVVRGRSAPVAPLSSQEPKVNKRFKPKHFASGAQAQSIVKTSTTARYNLDILNSGNGHTDGNIAMPDIFFPPPQTPHIFIVDTVVDINHVELFGRADVVWDGYPNEADLGLCETHGTHVAAIAGGSTVGVNRAAHIHSVKVLNCEGYGYMSDLIAGVAAILEYCTNVLGGKAAAGIVANMSFGGSSDPNSIDASPFYSIINQTINACDAIFIAAAGNSADDTCQTVPAGYNNVLAVAATDINDDFASFSNYGSCVYLNAPGVNIVSAGVSTNNAYLTMSGTSMASPLVAGTASLHLALRPRYWAQMFPQSLFAANIRNKMLSDSINAVHELPNAQTTARLIQVNNQPITGTSILSPVSPGAAPPGHMASSASELTSKDWWVVLATFCFMWLCAFVSSRK